MEYLVPLLAVVVIGALTFMVARWLGGRAPSPSSTTGGAPRSSMPLTVSVERAREAAGLLDEDAHRAVYGHIAQNRLPDAMKDYRRSTGRSLMDAVVDVQSLALHPQVYSLSEDLDDDQPASPADAAPAGRTSATEAEAAVPGASAAQVPATERVQEEGQASRHAADDVVAAGGGTPVEDGGTPAEGVPVAEADGRPTAEGHAAAQGAERPRASGGSHAAAGPGNVAPEGLTGLTVPAEWTAEPAPEEPPFEAHVQRGDEAVTLSSRDLPPWLRDQLSAMVRDGNLESAAVLLSSHSTLSVPEAFELLRRMKDRRDGGR